MMFPIFQRYNFESNSQRNHNLSLHKRGCFRYFKDTILKAIHNYQECIYPHGKDVSDISKIQIYKRFTTVL